MLEEHIWKGFIKKGVFINDSFLENNKNIIQSHPFLCCLSLPLVDNKFPPNSTGVVYERPTIKDDYVSGSLYDKIIGHSIPIDYLCV